MEQRYALLEQGCVHTEDLTLDEVNEAVDRHKKFFPDLSWEKAPMSEVKDKVRLKGYLERQREIAVKYHSV